MSRSSSCWRWHGFCRFAGYEEIACCVHFVVGRPVESSQVRLLRNQGTKIFREVEIVPGCAVKVACPSCPDYSPEPLGTGRVIRNMLGWSKLEETERSGVWVFQGLLQGENLFSSISAAGAWVRKGIVPHSVGGPLGFLVFLFIRVWTRHSDRATNWKAVQVIASQIVEGYRTPDEALVC